MQWPPRHPFCRGFDAATSGDASGVMVHAVDKINLHNPHSMYNPVEVILDPSDNSLGILVRRALGKGRHPIENNDLLSVDVRAAVRALEPPRAPKTKTKKPAG